MSEKARRSKKAKDWDLRKYAEDATMGVDFIVHHHGASQVHIGGHSMGGILSFIIISGYPDYANKIRGIITLASAAHYGDR